MSDLRGCDTLSVQVIRYDARESGTVSCMLYPALVSIRNRNLKFVQEGEICCSLPALTVSETVAALEMSSASPATSKVRITIWKILLFR